jgi:hypothetical protein
LLFVVGAWVVLSLVYPEFFKGANNFKLDTAVFSAIYIVVAPLLLLIPTLDTNRKMRKLKQERLHGIAEQITDIEEHRSTTLLHDDDINRMVAKSQEIVAIIAAIEPLKREYELVERHQRTLPFRLPWLGRSVVFAELPILPALVPTLLQTALQNLIQQFHIHIP